MEIIRYLIDDKKNISNKETYSLDKDYYKEADCDCDDYNYCDCEENAHEGMGCADYFTLYTNSRIDFNRLKINHESVTSIKKDLPKLYFILNKLELEFEDDLTIKGKKQQLILCFRIIRLTNEELVGIFDILYDYIKNKNIPIFQALLLTSINSYNKKIYHDLGLNLCNYLTYAIPLDYIKKQKSITNTIINRSNKDYFFNVRVTLLNNEKYYKKIFKNANYISLYSSSHCLYEFEIIRFIINKKNIDSIFSKISKIILDFNTNFLSSDNQIELHNNFIKNLKNLKN